MTARSHGLPTSAPSTSTIAPRSSTPTSASSCSAGRARPVRRRATRRSPCASGSPADRRRPARAVRIADDLAPSRPDLARAARARPGLLHDRQRRARGQRGGRPADPADGPGLPALPQRRASWPSARATLPEIDFVLRHAAVAVVASAEDPISGGRHKVWGSAPIWVLPQTSTIASHLPKAVGTAIGIRRAPKLGVEPPVPRDSIVVCSFGDASVNHSTALGAFSAAARAVYQQVARADAVRLRGQRDRHLGAHARGLGRRRLRADVPACATSRPTVSTWSKPTEVARQAIDVCRTQRAARCSCTCAWCG